MPQIQLYVLFYYFLILYIVRVHIGILYKYAIIVSYRRVRIVTVCRVDVDRVDDLL